MHHFHVGIVLKIDCVAYMSKSILCSYGASSSMCLCHLIIINNYYFKMDKM